MFGRNSLYQNTFATQSIHLHLTFHQKPHSTQTNIKKKQLLIKLRNIEFSDHL